jgi:hypothetical protein
MPIIALEGAWQQDLEIEINWIDGGALGSSMNFVYTLDWLWHAIRAVTKGGPNFINPSFSHQHCL